ncbi:MAG: DUF4125 family protein [Anaerovoracaceae bacterium]
MDMEQLVRKVVDAEWEMFSTVHNEGGRASCQDQREIFTIMRESQMDVWGESVLESYLGDLEEASAQGRNLIAEKYAYMMEVTDPAGYEQIRDMLPQASEEKIDLVDQICAIQDEWTEEFREKYPHIMLARPARQSEGPGEQEPHNDTAVDTYARGEYMTYSEETLRRLLSRFTMMKQNGMNGAEKIVGNEMKALGYDSLEEADEISRDDG